MFLKLDVLPYSSKGLVWVCLKELTSVTGPETQWCCRAKIVQNLLWLNLRSIHDWKLVILNYLHRKELTWYHVHLSLLYIFHGIKNGQKLWHTEIDFSLSSITFPSDSIFSCLFCMSNIFFSQSSTSWIMFSIFSLHFFAFLEQNPNIN
jgi:hypothetical protein